MPERNRGGKRPCRPGGPSPARVEPTLQDGDGGGLVDDGALLTTLHTP